MKANVHNGNDYDKKKAMGRFLCEQTLSFLFFQKWCSESESLKLTVFQEFSVSEIRSFAL